MISLAFEMTDRNLVATYCPSIINSDDALGLSTLLVVEPPSPLLPSPLLFLLVVAVPPVVLLSKKAIDSAFSRILTNE